MPNRFVVCSLSLALAFPTIACSKKENATPPAPSASAAPQAQPQASAATPPPASAAPDRPLRGLSRGSPATMLFAAARGIELKDPQKATINELETKLRDDGAPKTEFKDLETELAAEVRAGKIDPSKLKPKQEAVEKLAEARHDREVQAIGSLHAALEPAQRKTVVTNVRTKMAEREQRMAKRREREAKRDPSERSKMRVERMTRDLGLDAAQQKVVETSLAANAAAHDPDTLAAEMKKRTEALLTAFEQDKFDAKKLADLKPKKAAQTKLGAEQDMLAKLVPTLKPEQREKLAAKMESPTQGRKRGPLPIHDSNDDDDD